MSVKAAMIGMVSLGMCFTAGCCSHASNHQQHITTAQEVQQQKQVTVSQVPSNVIKTVHQHIPYAHIVSAETMIYKGSLAYEVYVKSGNTVYILIARPDGNYLGKHEDEE